MINQKSLRRYYPYQVWKKFPGYHLSRKKQHPIDAAKVMFFSENKKFSINIYFKNIFAMLTMLYFILLLNKIAVCKRIIRIFKFQKNCSEENH